MPSETVSLPFSGRMTLLPPLTNVCFHWLSAVTRIFASAPAGLLHIPTEPAPIIGKPVRVVRPLSSSTQDTSSTHRSYVPAVGPDGLGRPGSGSTENSRPRTSLAAHLGAWQGATPVPGAGQAFDDPGAGTQRGMRVPNGTVMVAQPVPIAGEVQGETSIWPRLLRRPIAVSGMFEVASLRLPPSDMGDVSIVLMSK